MHGQFKKSSSFCLATDFFFWNLGRNCASGAKNKVRSGHRPTRVFIGIRVCCHSGESQDNLLQKQQNQVVAVSNQLLALKVSNFHQVLTKLKKNRNRGGAFWELWSSPVQYGLRYNGCTPKKSKEMDLKDRWKLSPSQGRDPEISGLYGISMKCLRTRVGNPCIHARTHRDTRRS